MNLDEIREESKNLSESEKLELRNYLDSDLEKSEKQKILELLDERKKRRLEGKSIGVPVDESIARLREYAKQIRSKKVS